MEQNTGKNLPLGDIPQQEINKLIENYVDKNFPSYTKKRIQGSTTTWVYRGSQNGKHNAIHLKNGIATTFSNNLANEMDLDSGNNGYNLNIYTIFNHMGIYGNPSAQKQYLEQNGINFSNSISFNKIKVSNDDLNSQSISTINNEIITSLNILTTSLKNIDLLANDILGIVYFGDDKLITENINDSILKTIIKNMTNHPQIIANKPELIKGFLYADYELSEPLIKLNQSAYEHIQNSLSNEIFVSTYKIINDIKTEIIDNSINNLKSIFKTSEDKGMLSRKINLLSERLNINQPTLLTDILSGAEYKKNNVKSLLNDLTQMSEYLDISSVKIINKFNISFQGLKIKDQYFEDCEQRIKSVRNQLDEFKIILQTTLGLSTKNYRKSEFLLNKNDDFKYSSSDISQTYLSKKNNLEIKDFPKDIIPNIIEKVYYNNQFRATNTILAPYYNISGKEVCFQKIRTNKEYKWDLNSEMEIADKETNGLAAAAFRVIGVSETGNPQPLLDKLTSDRSNGIKTPIILTEGLATGHSLENIGIPVLVCLNAHNIKNVIKEFSNKYDNIEFIIAGEKDKYIKQKINKEQVILPVGTNELKSLESIPHLNGNNFIYITSNLLSRMPHQQYVVESKQPNFNDAECTPDGTDFNDAEKTHNKSAMLKDFSEQLISQGRVDRSYMVYGEGGSKEIATLPTISTNTLELAANIVNIHPQNIASSLQFEVGRKEHLEKIGASILINDNVIEHANGSTFLEQFIPNGLNEQIENDKLIKLMMNYETYTINNETKPTVSQYNHILIESGFSQTDAKTILTKSFQSSFENEIRAIISENDSSVLKINQFKEIFQQIQLSR